MTAYRQSWWRRDVAMPQGKTVPRFSNVESGEADDEDEDWEACEPDLADGFCEPDAFDDEPDEPDPEYGDFWPEPEESDN